MRLISMALISCVLVLAAALRVSAGCSTDMECKGDRICVHGECQNPPDVGDGNRPSGEHGRTTGQRTGGTPAAKTQVCYCCCFSNGQRTCLPPGPGVVPGANGARCHIGRATGTFCCD